MIVQLILGDWSDDGHGKTSDSFIESNLSPSDIGQAYKKGTEIVGFNFEEQVCSNYEDRKLLDKYWEKLFTAGINIRFSKWDKMDGGYYLNDETYTEIYLKIVKLGDKNFKYEATRLNYMEIGGYGLFH